MVEGVNIVKKHIKRGRARQAGIVEVEAPLHVSNVMLICPSCKQPTRVGVREGADGKNVRYCKKCDAADSAAGGRIACEAIELLVERRPERRETRRTRRERRRWMTSR